MKVSFLLDESAQTSILKVLKRKGFEATRLIDLGLLGLRNSEVAELAMRKNKVILTLDSDFLRLRSDLLTKVKVIFINLHPRDPSVINRLLEEYIDRYVKALKTKNIVALTKQGIKTS